MTEDRFRRWVFRLVALVSGVLLAAAVGEGALRLQRALSNGGDGAPELDWARRPSPPLFGGDCATQTGQAMLGDILWPSDDLDIIYRLIPGLDTCFRGVRLRTNAEGLRAEKSHEVPKPPGVVRLLLLGDSQAFGWGVSERQTLGARLASELASSGSDRVEVINAAVPGYNTYQQAALLERVGMEYEPDCVLVLFTSNDLALPFFLLKEIAVPERRGSLLLARIEQLTGSKRWFRFASEELIGYVEETELERVPEGYRQMVGLGGYRRALTRIAAAAAEVPVVNVAELSEMPAEIGEEIVALQGELGIVHLPITWPRQRRFQLDPAVDPHPNPAAHRVFAGELALALVDRGLCRLAPQSF